MNVGNYKKAPSSNLNYIVDWTDFLDADTIVTSTWASSPAGLTLSDDDILSGNQRTVTFASGGTTGQVYVLTNSIVTAGGLQDQRTITITVGAGTGTFTYTPFLRDLDWVRFHLGDVIEDRQKFNDETIQGLLDAGRSMNQVVIDLIEQILIQLAVPDFKADWLDVKPSQARAVWEGILAAKRIEFGMGAIVATTVHTWRPDTKQRRRPVYPE